MSWESCIVLLNSDSTGSFYSGDIVTGSVVLEFKKEQKVEHVSFKVSGVSKAQWSRSTPSVPYIKLYSEKSIILEYDIDVFSELKGKRVRPGIHTFHFHFLLPGYAPSTFKSSIAEVYYHIRVDGKAYCKFRNQKIIPFTVQGNVNINHLEEYLVPAFTEITKSFWKSGSFTLCFKSYKGFAPKQFLQFEAILTNEKKVRISKITVILVQKLHYSVPAGYAKEEKEICKVEHKKFSQTLTEICRFGMEVPPTAPSSIHINNPMVDISYVLRVETVFPYHRTLTLDVPVTIATIPVIHHDFHELEYKI